ncbi:UNVERIFIED_CONTAM: hypothetical protein FKN15_064027 [Acipenser sinensis]
MTGIAAASFFSNTCRFGGCGLHFITLAELIEHIEDNHIGRYKEFSFSFPNGARKLFELSSDKQSLFCTLECNKPSKGRHLFKAGFWDEELSNFVRTPCRQQ